MSVLAFHLTTSSFSLSLSLAEGQVRARYRGAELAEPVQHGRVQVRGVGGGAQLQDQVGLAGPGGRRLPVQGGDQGGAVQVPCRGHRQRHVLLVQVGRVRRSRKCGINFFWRGGGGVFM